MQVNMDFEDSINEDLKVSQLICILKSSISVCELVNTIYVVSYFF